LIGAGWVLQDDKTTISGPKYWRRRGEKTLKHVKIRLITMIGVGFLVGPEAKEGCQ
jgi:hypothetical protein